MIQSAPLPSARWSLAAALALGALTLPGLAAAQDGAGASASGSASVSADTSSTGASTGAKDDNESGAFLAAGKVGGIASFNGLKPMVQVGVEVGWVFGGGRNIGVMLQAEYTPPPADASAKDAPFDPARTADGTYKWKIVNKELVLQPTFLYRFTGLSDSFTPYAGIGPRIYLLESVVRGSAGGVAFKDTYERSTKWGFGVPIGAEYKLGPGGLFAEILLQYGPLKHETTGDTNLGGGTLFLGYRALI